MVSSSKKRSNQQMEQDDLNYLPSLKKARCNGTVSMRRKRQVQEMLAVSPTESYMMADADEISPMLKRPRVVVSNQERVNGLVSIKRKWDQMTTEDHPENSSSIKRSKIIISSTANHSDKKRKFDHKSTHVSMKKKPTPAFDIRTVSTEGFVEFGECSPTRARTIIIKNHVPSGYHSTDRANARTLMSLYSHMYTTSIMRSTFSRAEAIQSSFIILQHVKQRQYCRKNRINPTTKTNQNKKNKNNIKTKENQNKTKSEQKKYPKKEQIIKNKKYQNKQNKKNHYESKIIIITIVYILVCDRSLYCLIFLCSPCYPRPMT